MSNHSLFLKEFIEPLPICQPETDLGSILSIFQYSNCKMLAVSQGTLGWGVIHSKDLLSLVAEAWLGNYLKVTSHPRFRHQQPMSCKLIPDVKTLIKPATVYQADTKINEFLDRLEYGSLLAEERVCLIVNQQGELQGRLDRDKIIAYSASKARSVENLQLSPSLDDLTILLEAIAYPSKIETVGGQLIYANQLWQQLIAKNQEATPKALSASTEVELDEMTKWLIDRQRAFLPPHPQEDNRTNNRQPDLTEASLSVEITEVSSWNYLKIPLISDRAASRRHRQQRESQAAGESYHLVLATPQIESDSAAINDSTSTLEIATNQLLATVSHELKSPLTGIIGLTSLLQGQKLGSLNQRQTRYVELIYHSGKKMMNVVDDLLQLTALIADPPRELESINLESLCRQLYREVLTKVNSMSGKLNSTMNLAQPKLSIKPGSEIAIANKLLLSFVLSHLMLEALVAGETVAGETIEPLKIQVKSSSELTTIVITGQAISATVNPGLNLMIAQCLSETLEARITHACSTTSCQFTLLLPNKNSSLPLTDVATPQSISSSTTAKLTILCLYPELEVIDPQANHSHSSSFDFKSWLNNYEEQTGYQHRIIEADSLEQAHNLARIWQLDAIILNGEQIAQPSLYLRSLQESEHLATLPLITLDTKTTEVANQIAGLNVYPCLLPAQQCNIANLIQVIQIAMES